MCLLIRFTIVSNTIHKRLLEVAAKADRSLHSIIDTNGVMYAPKPGQPDIFTFLAKTLVGQQLSQNAASTIWARLVSSAQDAGLPLATYCDQGRIDILRSCGLSARKAEALLALRSSMLTESISDNRIANCEYEEIVSLISGLQGFGQWSADMVAIFYARLPDVLPVNDAALTRGLTKALGAGYDEATLDMFRPYRSYLARHIWKALDTGLFD